MNMLRNLTLVLLLLFALAPQTLWAADDEEQEINTLFVWQTDGTIRSYIFFAEPVVTFTADEMVVTMDQRQDRLPLHLLAHFTYGYTEVAGLRAVQGDSPIQIYQGDEELIVSHLQPSHNAQVVDTSGRVLWASPVAADGILHLPLTELSSGAYLFCIDGFTYKFVK